MRTRPAELTTDLISTILPVESYDKDFFWEKEELCDGTSTLLNAIVLVVTSSWEIVLVHRANCRW